MGFFDFFSSQPQQKPCTHIWEIVKDVTYPSAVEQLGLQNKPFEEVKKLFRQMDDRDFEKRSFVVAKCTLCGDIKEISDKREEHRYNKECKHIWEEVTKIPYLSRVEQLGLDKLQPSQAELILRSEAPQSFFKKTLIVLKCLECGGLKTIEDIFRPGDGNKETCRHSWEVVEKVVKPSKVDILIEKGLVAEGDAFGEVAVTKSNGMKFYKLRDEDFERKVYILLKCTACGDLKEKGD